MPPFMASNPVHIMEPPPALTCQSGERKASSLGGSVNEPTKDAPVSAFPDPAVMVTGPEIRYGAIFDVGLKKSEYPIGFSQLVISPTLVTPNL